MIVNGQKTWSTAAHVTDYCWLLAETDPNAPKHRNATLMIVDNKSPGITIQPIRNICDTDSFNDVFFDNVRVHKRYLVGEKNRGFYQVLHQLDYERSGMERLMGNHPLFEGVIQFAKENKLSRNPVIRNKLAQLQIEFEVGRLLVYRVAMVMEEGRAPNWESSMSKAYCTSSPWPVPSYGTAHCCTPSAVILQR